jgi:hypothetical protein
VVVDNYLPGGEENKKFYEKTGAASNGFIVVAAGGKLVKNVEGGVENLRELVKAYRGLPEADRKPELPKSAGKENPDEMPPTPPSGGLTLIVYNTPLEQTSGGELIRARKLTAPGPSWPLETPITLNDLLWLTRAEAQALVPQNPQKGQKGRVPETAQRRLFMYEGYDWECGYQNDVLPFREGDLTWTVEEVDSKEVVMRLEGFSKVGGGPEEMKKCSCRSAHDCNHYGSDLDYHGFMKIDRSKNAIVEFRLVGLGETRTKYNRRIEKYDAQVHQVPTGLVIELASDSPVNRTGWPSMAPHRMRQFRFDYWNPGTQ